MSDHLYTYYGTKEQLEKVFLKVRDNAQKITDIYNKHTIKGGINGVANYEPTIFSYRIEATLGYVSRLVSDEFNSLLEPSSLSFRWFYYNQDGSRLMLSSAETSNAEKEIKEFMESLGNKQEK